MGKFRNVRSSKWRLRHGTSYPVKKTQDSDEPKLYKTKGRVGHGFDFNYNVAAPSEHIVRKDIAGMHTGVKCINCKKEFNLFTSKDSEECDDCYDNPRQHHAEHTIGGKKYY
tara:strand:- start:661 stop:996 length:336 start_codon:yes stop_codon:yes gene_type:complete